ncbi:hypothetical protein BV898_19828 [Hypsibius exemplaris]|uniref:Uncharacterized protein n=1 Tax=Hypsibius exemplaris TaxID=2072580 RepID=A0A9X6NM97_HYPEX|nr:hypothetical protein BV898_19828 [Hypsibius exemplaris]
MQSSSHGRRVLSPCWTRGNHPKDDQGLGIARDRTWRQQSSRSKGWEIISLCAIGVCRKPSSLEVPIVAYETTQAKTALRAFWDLLVGCVLRVYDCAKIDPGMGMLRVGFSYEL